MERRKVIKLVERREQLFAATELPEKIGREIYARYGSKLSVESPSIQTRYRWRLNPSGWVGDVCVGDDYRLSIIPKAPVSNIFRMIEWCYDLVCPSFYFDELVSCDSLVDFFERFAAILARFVLDRSRRGLYQCYEARSDELHVLRGRLRTDRLYTTFWRGKLQCEYDDQTLDNLENQIIAAALYSILQTPLRSSEVLSVVARAYRVFEGAVTVRPIGTVDFQRVHYHRLNQDYRLLHAISRFFLDSIGPRQGEGELSTFSFLIDMDQLFEHFAAEWFRRNTPADWDFKSHEIKYLSHDKKKWFDIDLLWRDRSSGEVVCIADTKNKIDVTPQSPDVRQMFAYAGAVNTKNAFLIYPFDAPPVILEANGITVRSVSFRVDGDLDVAGKTLISELQRMSV